MNYKPILIASRDVPEIGIHVVEGMYIDLEIFPRNGMLYARLSKLISFEKWEVPLALVAQLHQDQVLRLRT
jgi:hypothetical protein